MNDTPIFASPKWKAGRNAAERGVKPTGACAQDPEYMQGFNSVAPPPASKPSFLGEAGKAQPVTIKRRQIYVTTDFIGFHQWADAPDDLAYLRSPHRHKFIVKAWADVTHPDRDVEFHTLQMTLRVALDQLYKPECLAWSCETWAEQLLNAVRILTKVEVSEDGENGAIVERA